MKFVFKDAFHELIWMERDGCIDDEDASLQMLMMYWGI